MLSLTSLVAVGILAQVVTAQASLYIPGFDPQPVTANEIGVGSDGRTTYLIAPGVTSGSFNDFGFDSPATVIAGSDHAQLILSETIGGGMYLNQDCTISGDIADCTAIFATGTDTQTSFVTETVRPFEIQGGGPLSSGASAPSVGSTPSSTPTAGSGSGSSGPSQTSSVPSQTSSGPSHSSSGLSPSASTTQNGNAGSAILSSSLLVSVIGGLVVMVLI